MSQPQLAIVVDTEEEFDWTKPFDRSSRTTSSIPGQALAHRVYDEFGAVPTYVIDYPVATDPNAIAFLGALKRDGKAEIGAHLHPWVCPPDDEVVTTRHSYQCNLPPALERAKMAALTDAITAAFGDRPKVFKAGRYGFGPNTQQVLIDLQYEIDTSYVPHVSFESDSGPNYYNTPDQPFWLDEGAQLLEVPLTSGFIGGLARLGGHIAPLFDSARGRQLRLPGALAKSGLVARSRLTPEGVSAEEQCALLSSMVAQGRDVFVLTYHSPSLAVGHTPYVRTQDDLDAFVARIAAVLRFFRDELGGRFTTLTQLRAERLLPQVHATP